MGLLGALIFQMFRVLFILAVGVLVFFLVLGLLHGAPVPRSKPVPLPADKPQEGEWTLHWSDARWHMKLHKNGAYEAFIGKEAKPMWTGSWTWDVKTRTFCVMETTNNQDWLHWNVELDKELSGTGRWLRREEGVMPHSNTVNIKLVELPFVKKK